MGIFDLFKKKNKKAGTANVLVNAEKKIEKEAVAKTNQSSSSDSFLKIIVNESIPGVQDQNNNPLFARDYKNKRVILSGYAFGDLVKSNELGKCVEYLKNADKAEYITLYWNVGNTTKMVNLNLHKRALFFVPMNYDSDAYLPDISDDSVHYTVDAARLSEGTNDTDVDSNSKIMRFCAVKNQETGEQFIPLFKTKEELRMLFPKSKYRICSMTYEEAVHFGREFSGIVYRPTEENLILLSDEACLFASINEFIKPYVDYRKYTSGEKTIQDKITKLQSMDRETNEFGNYYRGILQDIYDLDTIYTALNPEETDTAEGMGVPIVSKKDGNPAVYLFSDIQLAEVWTNHYNNFVVDGVNLIGVLKKKDDFLSIFGIASRLGIDLCMFDEGGSILGFSIKLFMDVNNMTKDIKIRMAKEEAEKVLNSQSDSVKVWFNRAAIAGVEVKSQKEYYELRMK